MERWSRLATARPELARVGRELIHGHGVPLAFLATVRPDGGPRLHPVCPVLADDLFVFVIAGPKLGDLRRDPKVALHSETFPPPRALDALSLTGTVREVRDPSTRSRVAELARRERPAAPDEADLVAEQALFEIRVERLLVTLTTARSGLPAGHTIWPGS